MKFVSLAIILLLFSSVQAQFIFPGLTYVQIEESNLNGSFGYLNSLQFESINQKASVYKNCYQYEDPTVLLGKLTMTDNSVIEFHYTEAPSDDPTFIAVRNGNIVLEEAGNTLHIKGMNLYIEGIGNSYFDKRRKFTFSNNQYSEVKQPFYNIGKKGILNLPIEIYESEKFLNKVATLPEGYEITIVLGKTGGAYNDLESILVKSEFGLLGWFNFKDILFGEQLIDGFYFHGD